ncbi:TolC family protein [Sphingomonas sp. R3G8C]|uniref:TolC family protein n=1 Tax=Novosphingobium rhizosphaerae TaxID=1551649 RepID=UPI00185E74A4
MRRNALRHLRLHCRRALPRSSASAAAVLALLATPAAHAQDAAQDEDAAPAYAPELPADTPADIVEGAAAGRPVTTLADALRYAYWTSPTLLAQRSSAQSSDWGVAQARAAYGPKLDYALTYGWTKDRFEIAKGVYLGRRGWTSTATAVLTQPLFSFGRSFANERGARAQASYQRAVLHSAEQQALLDAVDAFVGLRRTRAAVAIAADNLSALTRELTDNQARLKAHEVTATDIQQVETRVELGRVQLLAAQRDAGSAEAAFIRMIGTRAGDLAAPPALQLPVSGLEEAYAYAEAHNPLILAAQERERASRASVEGAKADQRPRVDFQGTAALLPYSSGFSNYSDSLRQTEIKGVVTLSGPLFDSGERAARIHAAEAANDADWRLMDATLRENRAALASAWNDWQAQTSAIDNLAKAVESAQKAYDGAVLQERAGMFTTLDVLQLARELLQARSSYNEGIAGAYIAKAQVLAALGALDATWLLPDAPRHDAEKDAWRVAGKADVPLITATVRALDGLVEGPARPRPTRDPAAGTHAAAATIGVPETPAMP